MLARAVDAVVVGAGPAGAASAALLARGGCDVALVDRAHFPRPKACAEYMSPGVTDVMRRLGLDRALEHVEMCSVHGMDIVSPHGGNLRVSYQVDGRPVPAFTLPRTVLDNRLVQQAVSDGAQLVEGLVARAPRIVNGEVCGVAGTLEGREVELRATLTIVADGARSRLARMLHLARPPRWPVRLGLVAHYEGAIVPADGYGRMFVGRQGYCGVAPLPGGMVNVAMVLRGDAMRTSCLTATQLFERWVEELPALRRSLSGCHRVTPVRGVAPIGARTRHSWVPGALLVGDAAGFFDPFTGEGIFRALRGAEICADIGRRALELGDVSASSLAPYDRLRRDAFSSKQLVTDLVQLFVQYPALLEYAVPRLSRRSVPFEALCGVLGDVRTARDFLRPDVLWAALHP